jgi:hypothetical protein
MGNRLAEVVQDCIDRMGGSIPRLAEAVGVHREMPHRWIKKDGYWEKMPIYMVRGLSVVRQQTPGAFVNDVEGIRWTPSDLMLILQSLPQEQQMTVLADLLMLTADRLDSDEQMLPDTMRLVADRLQKKIPSKGFADFLKWYCARRGVPYSAASIPALFGDVPQQYKAQFHQQMQDVVLGVRDGIDDQLLLFVWNNLKKQKMGGQFPPSILRDINQNRFYRNFT